MKKVVKSVSTLIRTETDVELVVCAELHTMKGE